MPLRTITPVTNGTVTLATLDQVLTPVLTVSTRGYTRLFASIAITAQATDQFTIGVKTRDQQAAFTVIQSAAFATEIFPLLFASEDLASQAAGATSWLMMDVTCLDVVQFSLAFAADNGAYLIEHGLQ
jgi:hypothetical protein